MAMGAFLTVWKKANKRAQLIRHWNAVARRSSLSLALLATSAGGNGQSFAQEDAASIAHVQTAQFKIPFNVDARGGEALQVQLWVSADEGTTWQAYGSVPIEKKSFDFRAAAEGIYLFKVATIDAAGTTYPNPGPPLKVLVDTTKPHSEIRADINDKGQLVVDIRVVDEHLDTNTAVLRIRSDHESQWRDLAVELALSADQIFSGHVIADLAPCREVAVVFSIKDRSLNEGEASCQYSVPRTAAGQNDMTLASTKTGGGTHDPSLRPLVPPTLTAIPGATRWNPTTSDGKKPNDAQLPASAAANQTSLLSQSPPIRENAMPSQSSSPGRLVTDSELSLSPLNAQGTEELPLPAAIESHSPQLQSADLQSADLQSIDTSQQNVNALGNSPDHHSQRSLIEANSPHELAASQGQNQQLSTSDSPAGDTNGDRQASTIGHAYHCKSRAFSLDYSVEALGGSALADVELWGTEDGGREWQKWGSDPDRTSPFDVQVGNDGLFGFRMVIVGANGVVSNRPREGDSADVWINVDTGMPAAKIVRAVYGEGPEDGLLVIDYLCEDGHLVDKPITLSYSDRIDGPWTTIVTGLANTGIYLWKADPSLPDRIYLKLECVDKAGNIGTHRLDLPIDVKGLAPRGVIQGFRAIELKVN